MKRATITIPDELEEQMRSYLDAQEAPPSLTALVQVALRRFLEERRLEERQYRPPLHPLRVVPAERGSGKSDVSVEHDRYLTE